MEEDSAGDGEDLTNAAAGAAGEQRVDAMNPDAPAPSAYPDAPVLPAPAVYPSEGRLASALADHFSQGFDANFSENPLDESPAWLRDGLAAGSQPNLYAGVEGDLSSTFSAQYADEFGDEESPFSGGFDRRLAREFTGEASMDGFDDRENSQHARPLSLRSLQWIRRNMTSLRIIVSLQRVNPTDPL